MDITEEQLTQHYEWTVERIRFLSKLLPHTTESGRVEIRAVMDKLGFLPFHPGVMELETTLRVVLEKPSLLDGPQPELFLAVAEVLELSPSQTARRVRKAISDRMRFYREAETHPPFFDKPGMLKYRPNVGRFIRTFLLYLEEQKV